MLIGFITASKNTHLVEWFSVVVFIPCSVRASRRRTRLWRAVLRPRRNPKRRTERRRSKWCCGVSETCRRYRCSMVVRVRRTSVHFRAWISDQIMCSYNEFIFPFTLVVLYVYMNLSAATAPPAGLEPQRRSQKCLCSNACSKLLFQRPLKWLKMQSKENAKLIKEFK